MQLNVGKASWNMATRRMGLRPAPVRSKEPGPEPGEGPRVAVLLPAWFFPHYRLTFHAHQKSQARSLLRKHLADVAGKRECDVVLPAGLMCLLVKE